MPVKYLGKLGKKQRYVAPPGPLATDEQRQAWQERQMHQLIETMDDLFAHYGLDSGDWFRLAIRLAQDHVPSMQTEKGPRGGVDKWGHLGRAAIKLAIDEIIERSPSRRLNPSSAAAILARREPWKSKLSGSSKPAEALRAQYNAADENWIQMCRYLADYGALFRFSERSRSGVLLAPGDNRSRSHRK